MIKDEIRKSISKRIATNDECAHGIDLCCNEEVDILSRDINETIAFFENECTAEEFSWLSEVFDDVAEKLRAELSSIVFIKSQRNIPMNVECII